MGDVVQGSEEGTIVREALPPDAMAEENELNALQMYGLGLLERVVAVRRSYQGRPGQGCLDDECTEPGGVRRLP